MTPHSKLLQKQAMHFRKTFNDLGLKFTVISKNPGNIVLKTSLSTPYHQRRITYIVLNDGLARDSSSHISMTTVLERPLVQIQELAPLASFLHQLSMTLPQLSLQLDLQSRNILIRESFICARDILPDALEYLDAVDLVLLQLDEPLRRLERGGISLSNARRMADYVSENCYEEMLS
ncbi:hypothetical protein [Endozoicomonas numazuensis]|uniref:Uncharacterized protein n=1 Tax=Endozoicomonas numazuensis TaxID=1137799 RepID=A0A081NCN3_9GAMM|nr:hypothetical protein [Endozoicomonas numazuensis]KEQ16206.1 hypothetical protein GZ78_23530 [Endozoicomonas numazuensis]